MQDVSHHSLIYVVAFTRVVDSNSFTLAARQLGMSKATVSKHVSMLEEHLGARLLNRTTRSLGLTEAGARFYVHCQKIVAELSSAETELMDSGAAPSGTLRVSAPTCFGTLHLAPLLGNFLQRYPDLEIDMTLADRKIDLIESSHDVAVRIARQAFPGLCSRRLAPSPQVVCAAPAYIARYGRPSAPEDLADHNTLTYAYLTTGDIWTLAGPGGPKTVKVRGRLRADNGSALRRAVLSGFGLALMPTFLVGEDLEAGRLVNLLPDYEDSSYSVYAIHAHDRHVTPKVEAFVDFLEQQFGDPPHWQCGQDRAAVIPAPRGSTGEPAASESPVPAVNSPVVDSPALNTT